MAKGAFSLGKIFAPHVFNKALATFDKATIVIVSSCWGGAILIMLFALYTLSLSVKAKQETVAAAAQEPSLPIIVSRPPSEKEIGPLVERLEKRFPDISFSLAADRSLTVRAVNGDMFRTWLTVLSYIDTISPEFRWKIKEFCVGGKCPSKVPMHATLAAEKVSFSASAEE